VALGVAFVLGGSVSPAMVSATPLHHNHKHRVDLAVSQTATPETVAGGAQVTYSISVDNLSYHYGTRVRLSDSIPSGATLVSAVPSQGTCGTDAPVICRLGFLRHGAAASVVIVVETPCESTTLMNQVTVIGKAHDPNRANNSSSAGTTVTTPCVGAAGEVEDGGTVTTDPDGQGPQPDQGVFETAALTVPEGVSGDVAIDLSAGLGGCPDFTTLIATTSQPPASTHNWSTLVFTYASCSIPPGTKIHDTTVFWKADDANGEFQPLPACRGNHDDPDPCVRRKKVLEDGSFQYTVHWSGVEDPSWRPG
jgi:uncharacterized repeat protein (TIGR01451 family)